MALARVFVVLFGTSLLAACTSDPMRELSRVFERKGEVQLKQGIKEYEDGRLTQASASFQNALDAGLGTNDQVTAHKYLAFIHCVSKRERQCRAHFRTALELNSQFELGPAEAGHPMWGPVFRSAKEGRR
ncbi:MAG TPA: TssQ family T6SS-associated lipoprotein [Burkholderiales bacterium]|nr:TssQ family T6SS-associated lipoprotein [Burkholderiales bacterium]